MNRISLVTRLQLVNRWRFIGIPLLILGSALLLSLVVFALVPVSGPKYSGGVQATLWYFMSAGIIAMSGTFPVSQSLSFTRREFYAGTLLTAAASSAGIAVIFVIGGLIEVATGGYGLDGYFFHLGWLWNAGPLVVGVLYFAASMLLFNIGFLFAAVYRRWGAPTLTGCLLALAVLIVAIATAIARTRLGPQLVSGLPASGVMGLTATVLILAAVAAGAAYLPLRRATQ